MSERPEIVVVSGDATLRLFWVEDRYQHEIRCGDTWFLSVTQPGLESPVFNELHRQGEIVFLSGLSDDRHWSASVEPEEEGFVFDVACRMHSAVNKMGSLYATSEDRPDGFLAEPEELPDSFPGTAQYRYRLQPVE